MTTPLTVLIAAAVAVTVPAGTAPASAASRAADLSWTVLDSGSTARLRGLAAVSRRVAWASGSAGTVLRTADGGRSWRSVGPAGAEQLQLRDIHAFDADRAVALSIGPGDQSRVYRTVDRGQTWTETFRNPDPAAFYDCLAFFDAAHGLALSDPVDGRFRILSTADGGRSWRVLDAVMPPALDGEFAFAASGSCLVTADAGPAGPGRSRTDSGSGAPGAAWFATGGAATARVFRTGDAGRTWQVADTAVPSGPSAGIFSLAFRDTRHGIAVGGDFAVPGSAPDAAVLTRDGGRGWQLAARGPGEYRSGAAWMPRAGRVALAVGPTGSDVSRDGGHTWARFDTGSFDVVDCAPDGSCWASGEQGRLAVLTGRVR